MKDDERISGALQENLLVMLCFDDANCKTIRAALTPQLFESSVFKEVAGHAIDFIDQYGSAIKEHLPDHLEGILKGDDTRKAKTYERLLDNLFKSKDEVNPQYVISQLHKFVRAQHFKAGLIKAVAAVDDGRIDDAEVEMNKAMKNQSLAFEPGLSLSSSEDVNRLLDHSQEEGFTLGIDHLDRIGVYPRRKELFWLLAAKGKGKSWFITHVVKRALLQRWSCVVITLEMSEQQYGIRILQSFLSIKQRPAEVEVTRLTRKEDGSLASFSPEILDRPSLEDDGIRTVLSRKVKAMFKNKAKLRIKQFPMRHLTLPMLEAYLDGLERFEGMTVDCLCVDYPGLAHLDSKNYRMELGHFVEALRGIGVKRNCAVVGVGQGNRDSEEAKVVTGSMSGEDISVLATADNFLTYSQTAKEYTLGFARIFVEKARSAQGKALVLLTQAYAIGQFCLESVKLKADYFEILGEKDETETRKRGRKPSAERD